MITSERLRLIPLSVAEIGYYLREDFSFEDHFSLVHHSRFVPAPVVKAITERVLPKIESDPDNHLFYTLWVAIDSTISTVVAGIVFKGPPNENGEVELGAGTLDGFMNRGYMTETTKLLCAHALKNMHVKSIIANCLPDNFASQRTLEKCGFEIVKKEEGNWNWKLVASKI